MNHGIICSNRLSQIQLNNVSDFIHHTILPSGLFSQFYNNNGWNPERRRPYSAHVPVQMQSAAVVCLNAVSEWAVLPGLEPVTSQLIRKEVGVEQTFDIFSVASLRVWGVIVGDIFLSVKSGSAFFFSFFLIVAQTFIEVEMSLWRCVVADSYIRSSSSVHVRNRRFVAFNKSLVHFICCATEAFPLWGMPHISITQATQRLSQKSSRGWVSSWQYAFCDIMKNSPFTSVALHLISIVGPFICGAQRVRLARG